MIKVQGISKNYGDIQALKDVSFEVEEGSIVGFLGANGAGKTTTMDIISGCIGCDHGSVEVGGFDITEEPLQAKQQLGYLPDTPPLHADMRVSEFISYVGRLHGLKTRHLATNVKQVMQKLELEDVAKRLIGNLSKGFRQRVGLAQALVHEPKVLILDEPTEGLDPNQIAQIRSLISSLAGKHTILLSSHILSEVQNVCERVIIIDRGRIVEQGSLNEIKAAAQAETVYKLRLAREIDDTALIDISRMSGVSQTHKTQSTGGQHLIELGLAKDAAEDTIEQVARLVIERGLGLREMTSKTTSLEDVFLRITRSQGEDNVSKGSTLPS